MELDGNILILGPGLLLLTAAFWWYLNRAPESKPIPKPVTQTTSGNKVVQGKSKKNNERVKDSSLITVKLLFGSQTGTAEDFAHKLSGEAKKFKFDGEVEDLEGYSVNDLKNEQLVIFVVATYGEGEPTDNARDFYEELSEASHSPNLLSTVKYTVFGLGNKTYEHYNAMARKIDARMEELGAQRVFKQGEGDDDASLEDDFAAWKKELWPELCKVYGIQGIDPNAEDSGYERRYRIEYYAADSKEMHIAHKNRNRHLAKKSNDKSYDIKNPYMAKVTVNKELHTSLSDRSCRHIEIEIGSELRYDPGDHIGVYPENDTALVEEIATRLGVQLDTIFSLYPLQGKDAKTPAVGPCTIGQALSQWCDITSPPRKALLRALADYATDESEKAKLLDLSDDQKPQPYGHYIKDHHRSIGEVLNEFNSVKIPFDHFLEAVPRLAPRYYSISSSLKEHPGSVHVTSVVVNFETPTGRTHKGVCSNWLAFRNPSLDVPVFMQKANFHLPKNSEIPVVMVGPGTGLAPFRGFIEDRRSLFKKGIKTENLLFFGCRSPDVDFIYQEELLEAQRDGFLTLHVAFSRQQGQKKVYVQHLMEEHKAEIWNLLFEKKGVFYVCGDARHMAKDVHLTLLSIIKEMTGKTEEQAEAYLQEMQKDNRYLSDTWF